MPAERYSIGYIINCSGPLNGDKPTLDEPVEASFSTDGTNRNVGCIFLRGGFCHAGSPNETEVCYHLFPEKNTHPFRKINYVNFRDRALAFEVGNLGIEKNVFTYQNREILTGLASGLTRNQIAANSGLPINSVRKQIEIIYGKLGLKGTLRGVPAIQIATKLGLIDLDKATRTFSDDSFRELSSREIILLETLLNDPTLSIHDLADSLSVVYGTVKNSLDNIRKKIHTNNTPQTLLYYLLAKQLSLV